MLGFHTPNLKTNFMIIWKEFFHTKGKIFIATNYFRTLWTNDRMSMRYTYLFLKKKPSSSATPFGISTIYSVSTMWTLEITSAQFTRPKCDFRTLPHHLLKCVISTQISRGAVQAHLSVSASTIKEMTLHSRLSTFLIWTATFPPI